MKYLLMIFLLLSCAQYSHIESWHDGCMKGAAIGERIVMGFNVKNAWEFCDKQCTEYYNKDELTTVN